MNKNKLPIRTGVKVVAALGVVALLAGTAVAGYQIAVGTSNVDASSGYASGVVSYARNSSNSVERINCITWNHSSQAGQMMCTFTNAASQTSSCWSNDATVVAAARTIMQDSGLILSYNTSTGVCTELDVYTDSAYAPKAP